MMIRRPRLALIHATRLAIEPIEDAARVLWREAETVTVLEESLEVDRAKSETLTPELEDRILALATYAHGFGADGVLFTCSAFGAAIEAADEALPVPVMKPNEAMFRAALSHGQALAMIYTFPPAAAGMQAEFRRMAARSGSGAELTAIHCAGALEAKRAGDAAMHDRLIADCGAALSGHDAILLAQFSMASAAPALRAQTQVPVLTSPESAVREMRRRVVERAPC
jgi:Asp/Glu/hydantoin racemase